MYLFDIINSNCDLANRLAGQSLYGLGIVPSDCSNRI